MKKLVQTHEFILLILVVLLCVAIGIKNPSFWSLGNVFDLLKSSVTLGILALGVLVILISGDIDISFPSIAAFSMYVTCLIARATGLVDHIAILFGIAAALGGLLGFFNAVFIHFFRLPALIVTLGAEGARCYERDGSRHRVRPPAEVAVVDTVGAGDAFSSMVILGLVRGWAWSDILDRAQGFAAAVVGLRGAITDERGFYAPFADNVESP